MQWSLVFKAQRLLHHSWQQVLSWVAKEAPHLLMAKTEDGETPAHSAASQVQRI